MARHSLAEILATRHLAGRQGKQSSVQPDLSGVSGAFRLELEVVQGRLQQIATGQVVAIGADGAEPVRRLKRLHDQELDHDGRTVAPDHIGQALDTTIGQHGDPAGVE